MAFGNVEDLKYSLRKFGCVPNCCWEKGAEFCSQPPLLFLMVKDYFDVTNDYDFLKDSYDCLKLEYSFWMTKLISENGLNKYGTNYDFYNNETNIQYYVNRKKLDISGWTERQISEYCENMITEGESGEDHTPRFHEKASNFNPIDLNSILYGFENTMADFCEILGYTEKGEWLNRAKKRKGLIEKYCLDVKTGVFFDYDFENGKLSDVYCVACYLPFAFGLTNNKESIKLINQKLILSNGVVSCEKVDYKGCELQWGYPNCWAPHQFWSYVANKKVGNEKVALTIANNYVRTVSKEFNLSGKLFEKYDAVLGTKSVTNEYGCPEMLGWTAGVFEFFCKETAVLENR